ncbi:MAG: hypothetical protein CR997_09345 [Acidobacteria bacterium]|nr:MAG: hypothetical protein CR997_09345 [Acidobacteriota bacterium]
MRTAGFIFFLTCAVLGRDPIVTARVDRSEANVGDTVTYIVELHFERGWNFDLSTLGDRLADAVVHQSQWSKPVSVPDTNLLKVELISTLSWYRLGEFTIPSFQIKGSNPDHEDAVFETREIEITIESVLEEGDEALSDSKPQITMREFPLTASITGALLVLLIAAYFLWRRYRAKGSVEAPEPPPLPPLQEVNIRMRDLVNSSILKEGEYKKFYVEISQIMHHFFGRVFSIPGDEMTSFEFEEFFVDTKMPGEFLEKNSDFNSLCDRVKFAKYEPMESENNEVVNLAYRLIHILKPQCVEQEEVNHDEIS